MFRTTYTGEASLPQTVTHGFKKIANRAGRKMTKFHDLRHTHAVMLLKQNVHPKIVQERLGHSTISVTMDIYSHVMPILQKDAVKGFDLALETAGSGP